VLVLAAAISTDTVEKKPQVLLSSEGAEAAACADQNISGPVLHHSLASLAERQNLRPAPDWPDVRDHHVWLGVGCLITAGALFGFAMGKPLTAEKDRASQLSRQSSCVEETLGESFLSGATRRASMDETLRTMVSQQPVTYCGLVFTENMRVLALTAALFGLITAAQYVAAKAAASEALMADCVSMAVDALTYLLNIFVEAREGKYFHRELQLIIPAISLSVLVYFSVDMLLEARETLAGHDEPEDVNPYIIMGFSLLGIVFDAIALRAFLKAADKESVNMFAAFAHVGADFIRSITTLVASVLILASSLDGKRIDSWACIIVTLLILMGVVFAVVEWGKDFRKYVSAK
jgi:hypothetical protein